MTITRTNQIKHQNHCTWWPTRDDSPWLGRALGLTTTGIVLLAVGGCNDFALHAQETEAGEIIASAHVSGSVEVIATGHHTSAGGAGGASNTRPPIGTGGRTSTKPVEDSGSNCVIPPLPDVSELTTNDKLPDPFLMLDGTRITTKAQWTCRRAEISAQAQKYELGVKTPRRFGRVNGSVSSGKLTVTVGGKSLTASITLPTTGKAPYPAMIGLDGGTLPADTLKTMGVALISVSTAAMGAQEPGARGKGFFFDVNGPDDGAGALVAWAWSVSRIIDALEVTPDAKIDPTKIGITGCSRNGKGALMVGALDERITLTIPQESGTGGVGAWRVAEAEDGGRNMVQTLSAAAQEAAWFKSSISQLTVNQFPYDHHEILGMVAPRGLLILDNAAYEWLGVNSSVTSATAARSVFRALGVPNNLGYSNSSHNHCAFNAAELPYLQAFVQRFLLGDTSAGALVWNVEKATFDGAGSVDVARWMDWGTPRLR